MVDGIEVSHTPQKEHSSRNFPTTYNFSQSGSVPVQFKQTMGAGGSIPRTEYQIELAKSEFGDDLVSVNDVREELIRIRHLLHRYADEKTIESADLTLGDVDRECENDAQLRRTCMRHILHFRKMLRQPSLLQSRERKEQRRRLSLQGLNLAKLALSGVAVVDDVESDDDDDGLEEMPDRLPLSGDLHPKNAKK